MKRSVKITAFIIAVVFVVVVAGSLILPPLLKNYLAEKLTSTLHRQVTIDDININPWMVSARVKGVSIKDASRNAPFVSFDELYVNAEVISSLIQRSVVLKDICLSRPNITIDRYADGTFNFSDLIPGRDKPSDTKEVKPLYYTLRNIKITDGQIVFKDERIHQSHNIRDMDLSIPFLSNRDKDIDVSIEPKFAAKVNGSSLKVGGKTKPFHPSREVSADVTVQHLNLTHYLSYNPLKLNGRLVSALFDTKLKINFMTRKESTPHLMVTGIAGLRDVAFDDTEGNRILKLPALDLVLKSALPLDQDFHLSRVAFDRPEIVVQRDKDGRVNLLDIMPPSKSEKKSALKMRIDELVVDAASISFLDAVPATPVKIVIHPLDFEWLDFSTERDAIGELDLSLILADKKGAVSASGTMVLDPLKADIAMDVKNIAIRLFQPYFHEKVRINITGGALSSKGEISLVMDEQGKPKADFKGVLSVSDFASVDKGHANTFLNWKELYFEGIKGGYNPFSVDIKGISVADFFARVIVNPDGTLNIQNILMTAEGEQIKSDAKENGAGAPAEKGAEAEATGGAVRNVKIGEVILQGGTIDFSDGFITPNYRAKMFNLAGSVKGLSSEESSKAQVDLKGNLGSGSPIVITGEINPLVKDLFADMELSFKNIELSPMTPYASKYLGHPILKGKLTYDAQYHIDKRKLKADNNIFFDQLTLGDRVESPDALKAPVKLAVALLADRNGQINLDIPVTGSLDDPQFSVWSLVWKVIGNLIIKAATSPFALLSALTGGGEEMSYIEFEYGSARVTDQNMEKIKSLVKVLKEKPALKMDIRGHVDQKNDVEGWKAAELMRKIKAQKLNDLIKKGEPVKPLDRIEVEPPEYEKYLTLAYQAAPFPKPRTDKGELKILTRSDMEKLMTTHIEMTDSDLRQLATQRAQRVRDLIIGTDGVAPERLFIIEAAGGEVEVKDKVKDSRVDIKLKL
ncbi:MAG: DUF748 domain-containing protein [Deltaproteobacteria bacterium]|nr:DUF748 domain-containing protein [Deltaproteobacteria bacterium]